MTDKQEIEERLQANLYIVMLWLEEEQEHSPCSALKNAIKLGQEVLQKSTSLRNDEVLPQLIKLDGTLKMLADLYGRTSDPNATPGVMPVS